MSKGRKRFIVLFVLVASSIALMSYQHKKNAFYSFDGIVSYPYYKLSELTSNIAVTIDRIQNTFEENRQLRKDVGRLLLAEQQYREIVLENARLKALLSLKDREPGYLEAAKVIAKGSDRLLNLVVLDKGQESGIEKGMAVITPNGLVGKIYSVSNSFSEVLLLRDSNFSVAVRLQNSRHEGIVSGTGNNGYCLLNYIPPEEVVQRGEVVITSGLDGIFPEGLPVGVVRSVKKEGIEFYQHIEVIPFQSSGKLEEVIVLKRVSLKS
jgi:rod shape-determining protein MreC